MSFGSGHSGDRHLINNAYNQSGVLTTLLFVFWLLCFATYSPSGRDSGLSLSSLDWIAVLKVVSRFLAIVLLSWCLFKKRMSVREREVIRHLIPFGIFAVWAICSTFWSPISAATLGHSGEALILVMLAAGTGIVCFDQRNLSKILFHLSLITFILSIINVLFGFASPQTGNGDFSRLEVLGHPNQIGIVASTGLVITVTSYLAWKWKWTRILILPAIIIHPLALHMTRSRTALFCALAGFFMASLIFGRRKMLPIILLILSLLGTIYLSVDPNGDLFAEATGRVGNYVKRDQTEEELLGASGRVELWDIAFKSFLSSPLIGHGYGSPSTTGTIYVWGSDRYNTAHNAFLYVLTGTGIIGGFFLGWGILGFFHRVWIGLRGTEEKRKIAGFGLTMLSFFLLKMLMEPFFSPLDAAPVIFFATVGIVAGSI